MSNGVILEASPDYVIFFDNQHVQRFVKSFSTNGALNGTYGEATIEMIYTEAFMNIDYLTDVKIFIKNVFSGKYKMIFDGQIHARQVYIGPEGKSITFTAYDNMFWLQRISLPLLMGIEDRSLDPLTTFNWLAKGINIDKVKSIISIGEMAIAGKNLYDTLIEVFRKIDEAMLFHAGGTQADLNNIYSWIQVGKKIRVLSDIDKNLRENKLYEFAYQGSILENLYVFINGIVSKLGYEFYQDSDGIIKIKEPFWNEGILKNFVIDPILVVNVNEATNWDAKCSRVFVVGGVEKISQGDNENKFSFWAPAGVYVGGVGYFSKDRSFDPELRPEEDSTYVKGKPQISSDASRDAIASIALSAQGTPYVWGGDSPSKGVDCSGLVYWTFNQAGFTLGDNTADGYYQQSIPITVDQVQIGDLGFSFNKDRTEIAHVGIYVGYMNGYYYWVHASSPESRGKVVVDKYTDKKAFWHRFGDLVSAIKSGFTGKGMLSLPRGTAHKPLSQLSDYERKYGINMLETDQPLIRRGIFNPLTTHQASENYLKKYSEYLYHVSNAMSNTSSISFAVPMPQLRQGFNLWFDPTGMSRIYYITNIRHTGSPKGVYTSVGLVYGRSEDEFKATYKKTDGLNPFTLTRNADSTEYFIPQSEDPLAVVNPDNISKFKEYAANRKKMCIGKGSMPAYNSPYRDWYGKYFIRRNTMVLNRWDTEFNLLELYCIISAGYKKLNNSFLVNIPETGVLNPTTPGDRNISKFARFVIEYDLQNSYVPDVVKERADNTARLIVEAEKEISGRYVNSPKNNLLYVK